MWTAFCWDILPLLCRQVQQFRLMLICACVVDDLLVSFAFKKMKKMHIFRILASMQMFI